MPHSTRPRNGNPWEDGAREAAHQRGADLENWLRKLNDQLALARDLGQRPQALEMTPFFIVGCARSGSTLLYQALASTGQFAYPTNIISRFHRDPYIGSLVHRVLFDMDRTGEIFLQEKPDNPYRNRLGKTFGPDAPHEFNYLWRNYFIFGELQSVASSLPEGKAACALIRDLAAIEHVFQRPLLMKAMELNWHLPILHSLLPRSVMVFIRRNTFRNAWSLIDARKQFFGNQDYWYSYKPAEYHEIKKLPPWEQAVAQVWFTERAVESGLAVVPKSNQLRIQYEDFCNNPAATFDRMRECEPRLGPYDGPVNFVPSEREIPLEFIKRGEHLLERLQTTGI